MKSKVIGYWATTILVALELIVGSEWDLTHRPNVVHVVTHLGYPVYLLTILGFWKLLAGIALLAPRFARLKEWAYAGVVFELSGAAASQAVRGHTSELVVPLILLALTLASWVLRPQSRTLGVLFHATGKL
jgi:uncharacterized membrane protein YphA (DoxX/SURF4 family)